MIDLKELSWLLSCSYIVKLGWNSCDIKRMRFFFEFIPFSNWQGYFNCRESVIQHLYELNKSTSLCNHLQNVSSILWVFQLIFWGISEAGKILTHQWRWNSGQNEGLCIWISQYISFYQQCYFDNWVFLVGTLIKSQVLWKKFWLYIKKYFFLH